MSHQAAPVGPVFTPERRAQLGHLRSGIGPAELLRRPLDGAARARRRSRAQAIAEIAEVLGVSTAHVQGVVSFYTMYHTHPVGRHFIQVCTTSPCHMCGAAGVVAALLEHTGAASRATSPDGRFAVVGSSAWVRAAS
ncbi:MAG: NAD(P)H-dependent oxidoreductase subunit E [Gemmatimonadales bacterium]